MFENLVFRDFERCKRLKKYDICVNYPVSYDATLISFLLHSASRLRRNVGNRIWNEQKSKQVYIEQIVTSVMPMHRLSTFIG